MTTVEELNSYVTAYEKDRFDIENNISMSNYVNKCVQYSSDHSSYLELGLGHGFAIKGLCHSFRRVVVVEGSPIMVHRFNNFHPNMQVVEALFENFSTDERFPNIGMGFVLEHVDDPQVILLHYSRLLSKGGSIFVGVPNASSMHRLLAYKAQILADLNELSELDIKYGHKRYWTHDNWIELFEQTGLTVKRSEGLYLKPFATHQMLSLNFDQSIFEALGEMAADYPSLSNNCFFELKVKREN